MPENNVVNGNFTPNLDSTIVTPPVSTPTGGFNWNVALGGGACAAVGAALCYGGMKLWNWGKKKHDEHVAKKMANAEHVDGEIVDDEAEKTDNKNKR